MTSDLLDNVIALEDLANQFAAKLPAVLASELLTLDQAQRLWDKLSEYTDVAEHLIEALKNDRCDFSLIESTETAQQIFVDMRAATSETLVLLSGLRGKTEPEEFD